MPHRVCVDVVFVTRDGDVAGTESARIMPPLRLIRLRGATVLIILAVIAGLCGGDDGGIGEWQSIGWSGGV